MKRQRRNNNRRNNNNNSNRSMESNGPDNMKIRGNISTIHEKYLTLARDAQSSGNRVKAENLLQHAEHYFRVMAIAQAAQDARNAQNAERQDRQSNTDKVSDNGEAPVTEKRQSKPSSDDEGGEVKSVRKPRKPKTNGQDKPSKKSASDDPMAVVTPEGDSGGTSLEDTKPAPKKRAPRRKKVEDAPAEEAAG